MAETERLNLLHKAQDLLFGYNADVRNSGPQKARIRRVVADLSKFAPQKLQMATIRRKGGQWFTAFVFDKMNQSYWVVVPSGS